MLANLEIKQLEELISKQQIEVFQTICTFIDSTYEMDKAWNTGGKKWNYEYKFRRGGKTLCAFYFKENCLGFMVILGKAEREKFEDDSANYSFQVVELYHQTTTYHDGKWLMLELNDLTLFNDIKKLLLIKRKPNKK
ncbi:DUF3788 domain-containing protein [Erysipelotrichaceae bacterium OttesenSCG-928-M19]|nr:DUF3788 domain-containing protein [Erysipelotrichaceae bacterium OttesenSCG-928-M19]